jgi:hypothetical protein
MATITEQHQTEQQASINALLETLIELNNLIATTRETIHQATSNKELEKVKSLKIRIQELEGRKISAETSLDLLKHSVAVPTMRGQEEKTDTGDNEPNCCVCMVKAANAIGIPCGHLCCCLNCLKQIQQRNGKCPLCRALITSIQQVHQSVSRMTFKTTSQSLAEPFSSHGITRLEARLALDTENGNISAAGHRLFQLALDRGRDSSSTKTSVSEDEQYAKAKQLLKKGNVLLKSKANEKALECFKQAIDVCPNRKESSVIYANAAEALLRLYRFEEAVKMCGLSIQCREDYYQPHYRLGKALIEMGHQEGAVKSLQRACALAPENASVKKYLAKARAMHGGGGLGGLGGLGGGGGGGVPQQEVLRRIEHAMQPGGQW